MHLHGLVPHCWKLCAVACFDQVIREGTQDQIAYFGQTPSQLLTLPHIKRMPLEEILHMQVPVSYACCRVFLLFFMYVNQNLLNYMVTDNLQEPFSHPVLYSTFS